MESDSGGGELKSIPRLDEHAFCDNSTDDLQAKAELTQLSKGSSIDDLRSAAEKDEINRTRKFKDNFEKIAVIALWLLSAGFIVCAAVWLWHILMPDNYRRLNADRLDKLQDIVTGGLLAGLVIDHFRKRMR